MEFSGVKDGGFLVLSVGGRMDAMTAKEFEDECARWIEAGEKRLVIDLSGLEYISSAGLRSILMLAKKLKAQAGDLAFCALSEMVTEIFTVSGFVKMLPVFATRAEALARP